jgi:hypothetical protein
VGQDPVEWPRDLAELERLDEVAGVAGLAAAAAAHVAAELVLDRAASPLDLLLEGPERLEVSVCLDHFQHALCAERADQLGFEVGLADVEVRRQAGTLEGLPELSFLAGVAEAGDPNVPKAPQVPPDRLCATQHDDLDALGGEVAALALSERLEGNLVAGALDENDPYGSLHGTFT